jgi:peptidyl-prolyl cis-trans isomerase SurA
MRTHFFAALACVSVLVLSACAGSVGTVDDRQSDPVVAEIGGQPLTLSQFEERYSRSSGGRVNPAADGVDEYEDFLKRYVDFRLKVLAGKEAGLDRLPDLVDEIETYRNNFARPYLLEQEVIEPLVRDVYERQQSIVRASHILLLADEATSPADTLAIYNRLTAIADSARAGADFNVLASRHSQDPSAQRPEGQPGSGGDLGYFSTGQMVEPFESYSYSTPVGELSPVFRTSFGYHVLYVQDRRPNPNPIRVAHLMLDPAQLAGTDVQAETLAAELVQRARSGEDFASLVQEYSHDSSSQGRGGELGFIEFTSRIVPSFIEGAFSIENVGEVSDVVETPFGLHIIKLLDRQERPTFEQVYPDLKQRVARMPRAQEAEAALARRIQNELGYTTDIDAAAAIVDGRPVADAMAYLASDSLSQTERQVTVATLGGRSFTAEDLSRHLRTTPHQTAGTVRDRISASLDAMLSDRAIETQARSLEQTDREFASLMREFEEGLILFRFMEDSVWTAAARDSAAIQRIYEADPTRYRFSDRHRVITVSAISDSLMNAFTAEFDRAATMEGAIAAFRDTEGVRIDTTYIAERTESSFDAALDIEAGQRTEPTRDRGRRIVLVNAGIDPARVKTLDEARPEIVSAYQDELEQTILERLRERFQVRTFPDRLGSAFADYRASTANASS